MDKTYLPWVASLACGSLLAFAASGRAGAESIGIFEDHGDVGTVLHAGSVKFDPVAQTYTVAGSGENMWFKADALHYVWKKVSGDVSLAADISFLGAGKNPHRKGCLIIRQSLDADSVYADAAAHGDGLTSLQFRDEKGELTHEVQANVTAPKRVKIEKRGDYVYLYFSSDGGETKYSGSAARLVLKEPFYIGIGVTAHDKDTVETAVFSNVELKTQLPSLPGTPVLHSTLETIQVASTDRRVVYAAPEHFEAPNWSRDGSELIYNGGGRLYTIPATGGTPTLIDTGFAIKCNNDHGISPDGKTIVISDQSQPKEHSIIYTLPFTGGTPTRITKNSPSYWHGWSPDGKTLAYCAQRDGKFGIFTIPVGGGEEKRLTTATKLDDGPDYSPDGQYIYFNSDRTGLMQIWRMKSDGSELEQITTDDYNNWFAHPSPDGKTFVYLTYEKDVAGHPANKQVMLRLMTLSDRSIKVLAKLFGGQGTINVPSWSPDGKKLAFVSYQLIAGN
jgi:Tol biopolymer transport system component